MKLLMSLVLLFTSSICFAMQEQSAPVYLPCCDVCMNGNVVGAFVEPPGCTCAQPPCPEIPISPVY